jgi:maleylacetoacetate isomerase
MVELVSTGLETDHRGIMVFTMPAGDPVTEALGTTDLKAFNPEGRIPVLLLPDGRKMTQSGPIIDFIEDHMDDGRGPLLPDDPWSRAEAKRIMWIIAADTQPYQNIPFIIQAMGEWGMVKDTPTSHPLRLHFIRREFGAIEGILANSAGTFAVGDQVTLADCFLVPQIRNALLASIDLAVGFPVMARVFANLLREPRIKEVVDVAGGAVQPLTFDTESGEVRGRG